MDAVDVFESLPMGTVRGNTSFWNVILRSSHNATNFGSLIVGSLHLLAFIHCACVLDPANTSLRVAVRRGT